VEGTVIARVLTVSYSVWKSLAQNHTSWATYHKVDGSESRDIWTGDRDHVYTSHVSAEDFSDWTTNFSGTSTVVSLADDAYAQIVGLVNLVPEPISLDGTPLTAKQKLNLGRASFMRIDDGSTTMAINGLAAGSPTVIWNGTGASDSGGDWTLEAQGTETAGSMHSGTNGLDSGVRSVGQDTRFDNGADIDVDALYDELSFWMNPQAFPAGSRLDVKWKKSGGGTPGLKLDVANYVSNFDIGVWQKVTIPIDDFALGDIVAQLEFSYAAKGGQHFYFDDFEFNTSAGGGPFTFRVSAPATECWHVERIVLAIEGADTGWNGDAFGDITSGLTNGLLLKHHDPVIPTVHWTVNAKNNNEMFGQYLVENDAAFFDSKQLITFAVRPTVSTVTVTDVDFLDFVVRDNLSSLSNCRAFLHYGVETLA